MLSVTPSPENRMKFDSRVDARGGMVFTETVSIHFDLLQNNDKKVWGWFQGGKGGGKPHSDGKN